MTTVKALLLLDVDGVLNPYPLITKKGALPPKVHKDEPRFEYVKHLMRPKMRIDDAPLPVLLSPDHRACLSELAEVFELVWATAWEDEANRLIAPELGIGELRVIKWPDGAKEWTMRPPFHLGSWKTPHIAAWLDEHAPGTPWAWLDDDLRKHDRAWLREHYGHDRREPPPLPYWLFRIESRHGLRAFDVRDLLAWGQDPYAHPTGVRAGA